MQIPRFIFWYFEGSGMTTDDKIRYGILALGGASVVLTAFGVHVSPLQQIGGTIGP